MLCDRMKIDVWEVIDAAATKPFGFMKFQPGPGLGGHCIPIDPFYLTLEGARVRLLDGVHRAGRQGQREHAVLLRRARCIAPSTRAARPQRRPGAGARRGLQGGHRRPARVAGAQGDPQPARRRRRRGLPRPATAHSSRSSGSSSVALDGDEHFGDYDVVVVVTAHSGLDYRCRRRARAARGRLPQCHRRHPAAPATSGNSDRGETCD